jgi:hypothetical protein
MPSVVDNDELGFGPGTMEVPSRSHGADHVIPSLIGRSAIGRLLAIYEQNEWKKMGFF